MGMHVLNGMGWLSVQVMQSLVPARVRAINYMQPPREFMCPIAMEIMHEPMLADDCHSCESESRKETGWLSDSS